MAPRVKSEIVSSALTDLDVNRDAMERNEEGAESCMFLRPGAMPELCDGHRGAQQGGVALTQQVPAGEDGTIPRSQNLNQNVGVDQNGLQETILRSRFPLRSLRTYVVESGKSFRSFHMPTSACIVCRRRAGELPYLSRTA
jgi:hypothetical protein